MLIVSQTLVMLPTVFAESNKNGTSTNTTTSDTATPEQKITKSSSVTTEPHHHIITVKDTPSSITTTTNNESSSSGSGSKTKTTPSVAITTTTTTTTTDKHCPQGTHKVIVLGCVKLHLTRQEAFGLGCKLGFMDNPDEEMYILTGGHAHSTAFTQGYNLAFGNGKDPSPCNAYRN